MERGQVFDHRIKASVWRSRRPPSVAIAAPEHSDPVRLYLGHVASLGPSGSRAAVMLVETIRVRPADRLHEGIDIVAGLGAVIHVIGVLVHIENEDRLSAGEGGRVV